MQSEDSEDSGRRAKRHLFLLLFLFLSAVITSAIAGYLLGRTAQGPAGRMVDTIELGTGGKAEEPADIKRSEEAEEPEKVKEPENGPKAGEPENGPEAFKTGRKIHLAGRILYGDGTPCADTLIQLHSRLRSTYTDQDGRFFFEEVEPGEHMVSVLREGQTVAESRVVISQEPDKQNLQLEKKPGNTYEVIVSATVRFIQVDMELDQEEKTLKLSGDAITAVTDDGAVVTLAGTREVSEPVVLPGGAVVAPDHSILLSGTVITPENQVSSPPGEESRTADETAAVPGEEKTLPDIIEPGTDLPEENPPDSQESGSDSSGGTLPPRPGSGGSGGGSGNRPEPDQGEFSVFQQEDGGAEQSWDVLSTLDLFYHKEQTAAGGKIMPGSKGYYDFKLSNTRKEALSYEIYIEETKMHIPMRFRIRNMNSVGERVFSLPWQGPFSQENPKLLIEEGTAGAGEEIFCRLEWDWPWESGRDGEDTLAGEMAAKGESYYLNLTVRVQAK